MNESYPLELCPAGFTELVRRGSRDGGVVELTDGGEVVAVVVPRADLDELQRLADEADIAQCEAIKAGGGGFLSHAEAMRVLESG